MKKVCYGLVCVLIIFICIFVINSKNILSQKRVNLKNINEKMDTLYLAEKNNKYGYINGKGEFVIEPVFPYAREFSDGVAAIKLNNILKQECFIDNSGKIVFNTDVDMIGDFHDGMALIWNKKISSDQLYQTDPLRSDFEYGYINKLGTIVVKPVFTTAHNFSEGLAAVHNNDGKWGFINKDGTFAIEPRFNYVGDFNDGLAPILEDVTIPEYSYIDKKGNMVLSPRFCFQAVPAEGMLLGVETDHPGTLHCIDYNGNTIFRIKGEYAKYFKDGLAPYLINNKWGYIDKNGKTIISPTFDDAGEFSEGLAQVEVNGKWGFIDKNGKMIIEPQYDSVTDFKNGICEVHYLNGDIVVKYAYINKSNEFIWKSW